MYPHIVSLIYSLSLFCSKELREKMESNQKREVMREENRIKAMQKRREHREAARQQREKASEEMLQKRNVRF